MAECTNFISECPEGFKPLKGGVTYWIGPYESSMEYCGSHCTKMPNCKSFAHNIKKNLCKLMLDLKRTENGLHEEEGLYGPYQFCTKGIFKN